MMNTSGTGSSRTENNNDKFKHQDREVRQESYLSTQYENPRQDAGGFLLHLINDQKKVHSIALWSIVKYRWDRAFYFKERIWKWLMWTGLKYKESSKNGFKFRIFFIACFSRKNSEKPSLSIALNDHISDHHHTTYIPTSSPTFLFVLLRWWPKHGSARVGYAGRAGYAHMPNQRPSHFPHLNENQ